MLDKEIKHKNSEAEVQRQNSVQITTMQKEIERLSLELNQKIAYYQGELESLRKKLEARINELDFNLKQSMEHTLQLEAQILDFEN